MCILWYNFMLALAHHPVPEWDTTLCVHTRYMYVHSLRLTFINLLLLSFILLAPGKERKGKERDFCLFTLKSSQTLPHLFFFLQSSLFLFFSFNTSTTILHPKNAKTNGPLPLIQDNLSEINDTKQQFMIFGGQKL